VKKAEDHYSLAFGLIKRGLIDEAMKELREAIKIDPELSDAHWILGRALVWEGNIDEGIEELQKAIRIDPECIGAHFYLGDAYDQNGKTDEAIKEFREVIRIDPEFPYAYFSLGLSLGKKGLFKEAVESFETYLKYAPPEDEETIGVLKKRLSLMKLIADHVNSDETREQDAYAVYEAIEDLSEEKEIKTDHTDSEKIVDKNLAMEIIAKALNDATNGGVEKAGIGPYKGELASTEQVQKLGLTKDGLIQAFLKDHRVISAECKNGEFHIDTMEGKLSFRFKFEDEKTSGSA
jgi:tetratricopeptide (TPR) repeat protein